MGQFLLPTYNTPYRSHHMRSDRGMTFPEFIYLLEHLWSELHPDIPIFAMHGGQYAKYPSIIYHVQTKEAYESEQKMRYREEIITAPDEEAIFIIAQRFRVVVNFSIVTQEDPKMAEAIIEEFEDFMMRYAKSFKKAGLQEIFYARRLPDAEENRPGEDVIKRTVSYRITIQKVMQQDANEEIESFSKINNILLSARLMDEDPELPVFTADASTDKLTISVASLNEGDAVVMLRNPSTTFPQGNLSDPPHIFRSNTIYYIVDKTEVNDTFQYSLSPFYAGPPINFTLSGGGYIALAYASQT